jgi:hypothetical protein
MKVKWEREFLTNGADTVTIQMQTNEVGPLKKLTQNGQRLKCIH